MKYSPISKVYIKNFRNIGEAVIDFSQSPIVTLLGENEAGKTSVIKAITVCALHSNPKDQKDYIRDGCDSFGVAIELEDGTQIIRQKEAKDGNSKVQNSYLIKYNDGTQYKIDKLSEGLPMEVQSLMGLIEEPETKEYLHVRTYEDKLLFVVTPNSTNYKVMYNALKVEQLTKAIKLGSDEVNNLRGQISSIDGSIETLHEEINGIQIFDTEQLTTIRDSLKNQIAVIDKIEKCKLLLDRVNNCREQLGALELLDRFNLEEINILAANKLDRANKLLNNRNKLNKVNDDMKELDTISEIDLSILNKVDKLLKKIADHNRVIESASGLDSVAEISEISEVLTMQLLRIKASLNKLKPLCDKYNSINTDACTEINDTELLNINKIQKIIADKSDIETKTTVYKQCTDYISQVENYLKSKGVAVEACPNCGEAVIFDIEKLA